jgi:hypothetical protein
MMKRLLKASHITLMLLSAAFSAAEARADVKIKTRQTSGGQTYEGATYIKGKRQRTESAGGQMITIQECDLRRDIQIMPQARAYTVRPFDVSGATTTARAASTQAANAVTKGGLVTSTVTTKDTGERKTMFGYNARHIITTIVTESSPDACSPVNSKMETDGWYIDAVFALDCDIERAAYVYQQQQQQSGCQDKYQTKQIGSAKKGFAVWEKLTMFDANGVVSVTTTNEVVELSQATLDDALFDVPAGYREVKDFSEAFATPSAGTDTNDANNAGTNGTNNVNSANGADSSNDTNTGTSDASKNTPNTQTPPAQTQGKSGIKKLTKVRRFPF